MRSTDINEASSRSHVILSIVFEHTSPTANKIYGKMTFIDLAGFERVAKIVLTEFLYEEAIFINESLKYLGYVIKRLAGGRPPETINYDYHPLTCLVRDTLGGTAKTLVLVNISPSIYDMEATMDSLRFAEYTGRIKTKSGLMAADEESLIKLEQMERKESMQKLLDDQRMHARYSAIASIKLHKLLIGDDLVNKVSKMDFSVIPT